MGWIYYALTLGVVLAGASFCAVLIVKYRDIKQRGLIVTCEVKDCYAPFSTRLAKEFIVEVTFEHEGKMHRAKCKIRCFRYYAPKSGEFLQLMYVPGENDALYPTKISRYPIFNFAVLMAAVAVMFASALIATIISLYITA